MDSPFDCDFDGGHCAFVSWGRRCNAQFGGLPARVLVVHKLRHLYGDGEPHQLADGLGQDDFLCHLFLHVLLVALFGDARFRAPAALYAGEFLGLGLYAGTCADGTFAHFHGEGGTHRGLYTDGDFGRSGASDCSDDRRDCLCRNLDDTHHGGHHLDPLFHHFDCRKEITL